MTYIGVELANEAREIVVFEELREQIFGENGRVPNDEG